MDGKAFKDVVKWVHEDEANEDGDGEGDGEGEYG